MNKDQKKNQFSFSYMISQIKPLLNHKSKHGLVGSINFGKTCYINSSIACLSNTLELTTYFLTKKYKEDLNVENKLGFAGKLAKEWYKLLYNYWIGSKSKGDPSNLLKILIKKLQYIKEDEEQDAHEYMTYFLDYLNEDLNKIKNKPYQEIEEQKNNEIDIDCSIRFWELHIKRNDSIITDLFTGQYKSTIECPNCKWISRTYDTFNTISLPIPNEKKNNNKYFDCNLFFIPKFSMKTTLKIKIMYKSDFTFDDILKEFKRIKNFNFNVNHMDCMGVLEKEFVKIYKGEEKLFDQKDNFFFLSANDDEENCDCIIPLYFKTNEKEKDSFSAFPRFLYAYDRMSFYDFKKKIFFFARQYINIPHSEENQDHNFEKILRQDSLNSDTDKKLIKIMENEYKKISKNKHHKYDDFLGDFPYYLYLEKDEKKIYLINNDEEIIEKLSKLSINNKEDTISKIIELCVDQKIKYKLILEFNTQSQYIKKQQLKFNQCTKIENPNYKKPINHSSEINLYDCFDFFSIEEILDEDNKWFCKKCKDFVLAKKKIEIFKLPKILIICLKRFLNKRKGLIKNIVQVDFPIENLDMKNFIVGPNNEDNLYDLYAVCQHYGRYGKGHYISACKNIDGWYRYDDEKVSEIEEQGEIVNDSAYILFYRRKDV